MKKEKEKLENKLNDLRLKNKTSKYILFIQETLSKLKKYKKQFKKINKKKYIESESDDYYFSDNSELDENSDNSF